MSGEDGYLNDGDWFKHSCHPTGDKRFNKLMEHYGTSGYAVFFSALEVIYSGVLDEGEIEGIADTLRMDPHEVKEVLKYCETHCRRLLYMNEDGTWSSSRAEIELEKRKDKRARRQEINREYWHRKKEEKQDSVRESKTVLDDLRQSSESIRLTKTPIRDRERERVREEYKENTLLGESKRKDRVNAVPSPPKSAKPAFVSLSPPSIEEVSEFAKTLKYPLDVESFYDYYKGNGWKVGKNPMKDWEATARNWARRDYLEGKKNINPSRLTHPETKESDLIGVEWGEL